MFDSARRKLDRAEQHIRDFESVFKDWVKLRPHRPVIKGKKENGEWSRIWIELIIDVPLPLELPLILGDAVHNLRCSLDHAMWDLIGFDGGSQHKQLQFPVGARRVDFEASARGVITPSQSIKDLIVSLAAYPAGDGELLYAAHALDRLDKHRTITPIAHVSYIDSVHLIDIVNKKRVRAKPFYSIADDGAVFTAPKGFGLDMDRNVYPTPDIFFPEVDVVPNEPVLTALWHMIDGVSGAVSKMEGFCTENLIKKGR